MVTGPVKRSFRRNSPSRGHFAIGCATVKFDQATRVAVVVVSSPGPADRLKRNEISAWKPMENSRTRGRREKKTKKERGEKMKRIAGALTIEKSGIVVHGGRERLSPRRF